MAATDREIITKITIDGSGAEASISRVTSSLNGTANAIDKTLARLDSYANASLKAAVENKKLSDQIETITRAFQAGDHSLDSHNQKIAILQARQQTLATLMNGLEKGTLSLAQANDLLAGKVKTAAESAEAGKRAYLEFMAKFDEGAAKALDQMRAIDELNSALKEFKDISRGSGESEERLAADIKKIKESLSSQTAATETASEKLAKLKIELGLVDAAAIAFDNGLKDVYKTLNDANAGFRESTEVLAAYHAQHDPLIKAEKEAAAAAETSAAQAVQAIADRLDAQEKLDRQYQRLLSDLGLMEGKELAYQEGLNKTIDILFKKNLTLEQAQQIMNAYEQRYSPAVQKEKEAAAAAEATAKAEKQKAAAYSEVLNSISPLLRIERDREAAIAKLKDTQKAAGKSDEQLGEDIKTVTTHYDGLKDSILKLSGAHKENANSAGLSRNSMMALDASVINTFQSIMAGLPPTMVAMQQIPQVLGALGQDSSGLSKTVEKVVGFTKANLGLIAGIGGITVATVTAVAAMLSYRSSIQELTNANRLNSIAFAGVNTSMETFALTAAKAGDVSDSFAKTAVANLVNMGGVSEKTIGKIIELTKDYAAVTGTSAADAVKKLGEQVKSPIETVKKLSEEFGMFSSEERKHIQVLVESGNKTEAQLAILAKFKEKVNGAHAELNIFSLALERAWQYASDFYSKLGKGLYTAIFGDQNLDNQVKKLENKLALLEDSLSKGNFFTKLLGLDDATAKELDQVWQKLNRIRAERDRILKEGKKDQTNQAISELYGAVSGIQPTQSEFEKFNSILTKINQNWTHMTEKEKEFFSFAYDAMKKYNDLMKEYNIDPNTGRDPRGFTGADVNQERINQIQLAAAGQSGWQSARKAAGDVAALNAELNGLNATAARTAAEMQVLIGATKSFTDYTTKMDISGSQSEAVSKFWQDYTNGALSYVDALAQVTDAGFEAAAAEKALSMNADVDLIKYMELMDAADKAIAAARGTIGSIQNEINKQKELGAAILEGVDAHRQKLLALDSEKETANLYAMALLANKEGELELSKALQKAAGAYKQVAAAKAETQFENSAKEYSQQLKHELEILKERQGLIGKSDTYKAEVNARREIIEYLYKEKRTYESLDEDQKKIVDGLVKYKMEMAGITLAMEQQQDAWNTLSGSLTKAFEDVGNAITEAFAKGEQSSIKWGNITKAVISSLAQSFLKLAVVNPMSNMLFGTNNGTLGSLFAGGNVAHGAGNAGGSAVGSLGSIGQAISLGQSGYNALTGSYMAMGQNFGGWLGYQTGALTPIDFGTGAAATYGAQGSVLIPSVEGGIGSSLPSFFGNAAAGLPFGAIGGIGGGLIGTATNSKALGGLSGAALGAGSAGIYASIMGMSAVGGPIGIIAAGIVGAVAGLLGTSKKSSGPGQNSRLLYDPAQGGFYTSGYAADNGGDANLAKQQSDAAAQTLNLIKSAYGFTISDAQKNSIWYDPKKETYGISSWDKVDTDKLVFNYLKSGLMTASDPNIAKAVSNTKATDTENLVKDLDAAKQFTQFQKLWMDGLDPLDSALKKAMDDAKTLGETAKTSISDWMTKVVDLKLATKEELLPGLKKSAEAMLGLGEAGKSLTGTDLVIEQAKLNFEAMKPVLAELGYTAEEQASLLQRSTDKLVEAYNKQIDATLRTGRASLNTALGLNKQATAAEIFLGAGIDVSTSSALDGLQTAYAGWLAQIRAGTFTVDSTVAVQKDLGDQLRAGKITAEQYTAAITGLTTAMQENANEVTAKLTAAYNIRQLDANYKKTGLDVLTSAGVRDPGAISGVVSTTQEFLTSLYAGKATIADITHVMAVYNDALASHMITQEQYTTAMQDLTNEYKTTTAAAKQAQDQLKQAETNKVAAIWQKVVQAALTAAQQTQTAWTNVANQLKQYMAGLDTGQYSILSPEQQLEAARKAYFTALDESKKGGDAGAEAAGTLSTLAEAYLKANQEYFGSTNPQAMADVKTGLGGIKTYAEQQVDLAKKQVEYLNKILNVTTAGDAAIEAAFKETLAGYGKDLRDYGSNPTLNRLIAAANPNFKGNFGNGEFSAFVAMNAATSGQNFGKNPDVNKLLAAATGYTGDFGSGGFGAYRQSHPLADTIAKMLGYAEGTANATPGPHWVGERGPEIVWFKGGETVVSNQNSKEMVRNWAAPQAKARSTTVVNMSGVEERLDQVIALNKALVYENAALRKENQMQTVELMKLRGETATQNSRFGRTGTYAGRG